jgi:hypothetical protein
MLTIQKNSVRTKSKCFSDYKIWDFIFDLTQLLLSPLYHDRLTGVMPIKSLTNSFC